LIRLDARYLAVGWPFAWLLANRKGSFFGDVAVAVSAGLFVLFAFLHVTQAVQECSRVRHILKKFAEVRSVVSKAGRPEDGTDPKQVNMAEFLVDTYPQEEWKSKLTKEELLKRFDDAKRSGQFSSFGQ